LNSPLLAAWDGFKGKLYSALSAKQSGADVIPCSLLQGEFIFNNSKNHNRDLFAIHQLYIVGAFFGESLQQLLMSSPKYP